MRVVLPLALVRVRMRALQPGWLGRLAWTCRLTQKLQYFVLISLSPALFWACNVWAPIVSSSKGVPTEIKPTLSNWSKFCMFSWRFGKPIETQFSVPPSAKHSLPRHGALDLTQPARMAAPSLRTGLPSVFFPDNLFEQNSRALA